MNEENGQILSNKYNRKFAKSVKIGAGRQIEIWFQSIVKIIVNNKRLQCHEQRIWL